MTERRTYRQFCGLARALDRVGERWTLLIVRNLLLGPRRYGELLETLPGITTNLLAKRLKELEELGLLEKAAERYALTALGAALEPAIMELARWGGRFMDVPHPGDRVDIGWGLLSMKRRYRGGVTRSAELRVGERRFELAFSPSYLAVQERPAALPAFVLEADVQALRALLWGGVPLSELRAQGAIRVEGDEASLGEALAAFEGVRLAAAPLKETARTDPPARALPGKKPAAGPRAKARARPTAREARASKREA